MGPFRRQPRPPATDAAAERRAAYDARVAEHDRQHPGYAAVWRAFADLLLSHGGEDAVPPGSADPLLDLFRGEGRVQDAAVVARPGEPGDCHTNAVRLWRAGETVAIGTGYALSTDGLWREHSWGVDAEGRIVETTAERVTYFGVVMAEARADWFAEWIDPPG